MGWLLRGLFRGLLRGLLLGVVAALVVAGCSTVSSRIEANPQAFNRLPVGDRALVRSGNIREGMGPQAVYLAWGKPDSVSRGSAFGHPYETWSYLAYTSYPGLYGGPGGYWGSWGGPYEYGWFRGNWAYYSIYQLNYPVWGYPYRMATFVNGKVIAWSASHWR